MQENPLVKKLRIKAGQKLLILNSPPSYLKQLQPLPEKGNVSEKISGSFDHVQIFVQNANDITDFAIPGSRSVAEAGLLWVANPKLSSKLKSDINRDKGWEMLVNEGWEGVSLISIDETWSALRFKKADPAKVAAPVSKVQKFTGLLEQHEGMDATYFSIPFSVVEVFGSKAQVRVKGTLNGMPFSGTLAPYGGVHYLESVYKVRWLRYARPKNAHLR